MDQGKEQGSINPCVLACVTNSPTAGRVIRAAARCSRAYGLDLRFLHVGAMSGEQQEKLRASISSQTDVPFVIDAESRPTAVEEAICAAAREKNAGVLVIGALEREKPLKDLVGSTARRVAQRAGCSVMLVSTAGRDAAVWRRFLVSVSLADPSPEVAQAIVALAHTSEGAAVCFASESSGAAFSRRYEPAREFEVSGSTYAGLPTEQHVLATFVNGFDTGGLDVTAIALSGRAGHEVARYADEFGADVLGIVAPNRPLGFLDRFFSQPTVVVMEKLPCSVLIVRGDGPCGIRRS
ncbi:MAG: universal stress protein [Phycisphaeraceae bacterium]|nr:universal stress protein [Phycisphaeraceae bacterium]